MRKLLLVFTLMCLAFGLRAQQTYLPRDTINIRGMVYDYNNNPATNIPIGLFSINPLSKNQEIITDASGNFELKGVSPDNCLKILDVENGDKYIPIRGSRYIIIYLQKPKTYPITHSGDSLTVSAHRVSQRKKVSFTAPTSDEITNIIEGGPIVIGGRNNFINYLKQHLVYPKAAIKNNIEGTVELMFTLKKDGSLADFKILQGLGYGCDEQVIENLKHAGKWHPALYMNQPVDKKLVISVAFKLTDK
jgi:TonB family protein